MLRHHHDNRRGLIFIVTITVCVVLGECLSTRHNLHDSFSLGADGWFCLEPSPERAGVFAFSFWGQVMMYANGAAVGFSRGDPTLLIEDMQVRDQTIQRGRSSFGEQHGVASRV